MEEMGGIKGLRVENPKKLAGMFVSEAEKVLGKRLMAFIIGSAGKGGYKAGKSDIDLIILARNGYIDGSDYLKILELRKAYGKKYGMIQKKGRLTPIIDPLIIFSAEAQERIKNVLDVGKIRKKCNRLERIVLDTLQTWQWNRNYVLKQSGSELFDMDELLEVISQYGPWTSPERELPISALYHILGYFEREGLVRKIGDDAWEICTGG